MTFFKTVSLTAATLAVLAFPAMARDRHGGGRHHGGYHGGSRVSIGIGVPLFTPAPYYYGPRYYGPTYYGRSYYEPAPVVVGRPVCDDLSVDVQRVLARKGYYVGVLDGDLGPRSRAAIRAWQADAGLRVTGTLNTPTLRSLGLL